MLNIKEHDGRYPNLTGLFNILISKPLPLIYSSLYQLLEDLDSFADKYSIFTGVTPGLSSTILRNSFCIVCVCLAVS